MDLLSSDKIVVFIRVEGLEQGFQALPDGPDITFKQTPGTPGLDFWEVSEELVPSLIMDGFKNWTSLSTRKKMVIVGLTPDISNEIRRKQAQNGRFIIGTGGTVSFTPFGD